MISGQLFLTLLIALLVFGPNKLPMLARHLGQTFARIQRLKQQYQVLWQSLLKEQQLLDNTQKALQADVLYQQDRTTSS